MESRQILLNPGPVTLSDRVRAALTRGDWCHREPEFAALVREILEGLAGVHPELGTEFEAVLLTGSGTAAVEAMLACFAPTAGKTLVLSNGVYGERMARMLQAHHKPHRIVALGWTDALDIAAVEQALAADSAITHVAVVHHETTTGRLNDLAALGRACRSRGVRLLVDAVSSFGAEEIVPEAWNLDAIAGTANKCLHGVPGLAFVLARRELWRAPPAAVRSVYLDLYSYHRAQHDDGFSPFTQAVQIAFALREALAEHREQGGWSARRQLFRRRAERVYRSLRDAGVETLLKPEEYSCVLWSYRLPPGRSYAGLHDRMKREGFVIYAGQGKFANEMFRIANMGDIKSADMDRLTALLGSAVRP